MSADPLKFDPAQALALAHKTFDIEAAAVLGLKSRVGPEFADAVRLMLACEGRVVVMGMGKSGHIGRKIAATLASTGTAAMFVHPAEASHGDLGMIKAVDVVLAISNSGESGELTAILPVLRRQGVPETPEDLYRLDTVAMSWTDGRAAWTLLGPDGSEFVLQHQPRYVADDLQTLKLAVLAGTGISFLPDSVSVAERQAKLLVPVLPGWAPKPGVAHAVFPSRRGQVPAVRSFLDFLGDHMRGETLI